MIKPFIGSLIICLGLFWAGSALAAPNLTYLGNASSTALSAQVFCLTADTCRTTWPAGAAQTPWLSNIDGGGFNLTNALGITSTLSTSTNATSTSFFATTASSTNLFSSLLNVGSNALIVNSSGNVGIGVSPTQKLQVNGNIIIPNNTFAYQILDAQGNARDTIFMDSNNNIQFKSNGTGGVITFNTNTQERVRIDNTGGFLVLGSTTLQSFTARNATDTNSTSTSFFATTASTTNFFGAGLATCQNNNVLTWAGGLFGCEADDQGGAASAYDAWTHPSAGVSATTSSMIFTNASSTFTGNLNIVGNATTTSATTTNLYFSGRLTGLSTLGTPTYSTLQELMNSALSAGKSSGGAITAASGNCAVAAGTGYIKAVDSDTATLSFMNWSASSSVVMTSNSVKYIGVEYNSGTPRVVNKTTDSWDYDTNFPLGICINEAGTSYAVNNPWSTSDSLTDLIERWDGTKNIQRDERTAGLVVSNSGTRNVSVTAGTLMARLEEYAITALDTSVSGSFDAYYRDGSNGWTKQAGATQWNNTQYDDSDGTLGNITPTFYSSRWWYLMTDGTVAMLYGQSQDTALATILNDAPPSTVPDRIGKGGILIGRFIIQASASTPSVTQSAFGTAFTAASVTAHASLSGLTADDHTQYVLLTGRAGDTITRSTTTRATSTNLFSDVFTANTLRVGQSATTTINSTGDLLIAGSSTLQRATSAIAFFSPVSSSTQLWATNATTSTLFSSIASSTDLFTSIGNSLALGNASGKLTSYAGTSCTNQFVRSLSVIGAAGCATVANTDLANSTISGIALGSNLANLSATDATLTFSGTYTGATARTIGLNLTNPNTWTGGQIFGNSTTTSATSTNFFGVKLWGSELSIGTSASTTINNTGDLFIAGSSTLQRATATRSFFSPVASSTDLYTTNLTVGNCTGCGPAIFTTLVTAADQSTAADTVAINATGMVFTFAANSKYFVELDLMASAAANTTGFGYAWDTSVAATSTINFTHQLANAGTQTGGSSLGDVTFTGLSSGVPTNAVMVPVTGAGVIISGASGGTAQFQFRSEVAGVTTLLGGSMIRIYKMR